MATVDVSVTSDLSPAQAWTLASDLKRFDQWLTIFGGWKSPVPDEIGVDTQVSSLIKVKGFRNIIHWRVTRYDEPKAIELMGNGRGGVSIGLSLTVEPHDAAGTQGSSFRVVADLSGGLLNTPVGSVVARVIKGDVKRSVCNLAELS
ncbi:MAG: SRPBCC family protein [Mycobacterium kyogaense]|uniref:type II toxin-antitoxin system Rv0910 family toxin n=1 Tax=Mycobacterium kyogaense TaxID=2212479 RepID=UPI002FF9B92E